MTISTTYLDADTDSVKAARAAILAMANAINAMDLDSPTFPGFVTMENGMAVGVTYDNPSSGDVVALTVATRMYINIGTVTKAALTFNLPASPVNGQVVRIGTDGAITALTVTDSGGTAGNVLNAPAGLAIGASCEFVYRAIIAKWYRCG